MPETPASDSSNSDPAEPGTPPASPGESGTPQSQPADPEDPQTGSDDPSPAEPTENPHDARNEGDAAAVDINEVVTPGTSQTASPNAQTASGTEAYDLKLADTRRGIAFFLLWITAGVIAAPVLASVVFSGWCWLNANSCPAASTALDLLSRNMSQYVTAMIGLVGSVVGFYFGSNSRGTVTTGGGSGGEQR